MPNAMTIKTEDKDLLLRDDIRLLGRILGDTVYEQSGEAVFSIVERIRQTSVRFRRDEDVAARRELEAILNGLPPKQALLIIRAFGFFSHLANIAEDQHHIRRTRAHAIAGAPPREGTMAHALAAVRAAGVSTTTTPFFAKSRVCTRRWRTSSMPRDRFRFPRFCVWAAGSAATATAIRS